MNEAGMLEKYYHSQGAALFDEGRLNEALEFFQRALALDDQPYTHWDLCRVYLKKGDAGRALAEIDKAVELNASAQYYYRRSVVRVRAGSVYSAGEDRERSIQLDPNYGRIDEVVSAAKAFEQIWSSAPEDEWMEAINVPNAGLAELVSDLKRSMRLVEGETENRSCILPCPAYCCHFSGDTVRHGLYIGAWKLHAIRAFLKEKGLSEAEFLDKLPFAGESYLIRLIPPHYIIKDGGNHCIYYPKRSKRHLGRALVKDLPKGKDYADLEWIGESARACAFLQKGRCIIHDAGDEPGLPACKEFLCLTARVFMVLSSMGAIEEARTQAASMAELNRIAIDAMLAAVRLVADPELEKLKLLMADSLKAGLEAGGRGKAEGRRNWINRHIQARERYRHALARVKEQMKKEVQILMPDDPGAVTCSRQKARKR